MTSKTVSDLYQETILRYGRHPRNFRKIPNACCSLDGQNTMCGDFLTVHISFQEAQSYGKSVADISFEGDGCAILKASASMMTDLLIGKSVKEIEELFAIFQRMVQGEPGSFDTLGEVSIFSGISKFQSRIQCAMLPWDTLIKGMKSQCHIE